MTEYATINTNVVDDSMTEAEIKRLVRYLDTLKTTEREAAWEKLRPLGISVAPYLAEFYPEAKKWLGRASLVFYSIPFARESEAAFQLGAAALTDKSYAVRHRACSLCAYSLRQDALPPLKKLLKHPDLKTVSDAKAAIDAIRHQNHHYFLDRSHSGKTFWDVNRGDYQISEQSRLLRWLNPAISWLSAPLKK